MKMLKSFAFLILLMIVAISCKKNDKLSEAEIVQGLKDAMVVSTDTSVVTTNRTDGYFSNAKIKVPFPEDAKNVESVLRGAGFGTICDDLILKLNRAAENASIKAKPIFLAAIDSLTVTDGLSILHGANDAATAYLRDRTIKDLKLIFKPDIQKSLDDVGATGAWTTVATKYNSLPLVVPVNTDLPSFATQKALDGLFIVIAEEELSIRTDANARVDDVLKKVFGELDK